MKTNSVEVSDQADYYSFYEGESMKSDMWFAVKRHKTSTVIYLVTGGDRRMVESAAKSMFRGPTVVRLTWGMLKVLTGCNIPGNVLSTDFARGQFMIPNLVKCDIVIMAL